MRGQPASSVRSPMTTTSASRATRAQISGPIPAGSPEVSAMTGLALFVKPQLDVGGIAGLAQPLRVRLFSLALAGRLARLQAPSLRRKVTRAALGHLGQGIAERRGRGAAGPPG